MESFNITELLKGLEILQGFLPYILAHYMGVITFLLLAPLFGIEVKWKMKNAATI